MVLPFYAFLLRVCCTGEQHLRISPLVSARARSSCLPPPAHAARPASSFFLYFIAIAVPHATCRCRTTLLRGRANILLCVWLRIAMARDVALRLPLPSFCLLVLLLRAHAHRFERARCGWRVGRVVAWCGYDATRPQHACGCSYGSLFITDMYRCTPAVDAAACAGRSGAAALNFL